MKAVARRQPLSGQCSLFGGLPTDPTHLLQPGKTWAQVSMFESIRQGLSVDPTHLLQPGKTWSQVSMFASTRQGLSTDPAHLL